MGWPASSREEIFQVKFLSKGGPFGCCSFPRNKLTSAVYIQVLASHHSPQGMVGFHSLSAVLLMTF